MDLIGVTAQKDGSYTFDREAFLRQARRTPDLVNSIVEDFSRLQGDLVIHLYGVFPGGKPFLLAAVLLDGVHRLLLPGLLGGPECQPFGQGAGWSSWPPAR